MRLSLPRALRDHAVDPVLAAGPFVLEHNGIRSLGYDLCQISGGPFKVEDESRSFELGDEYAVEVGPDSVTFRSEEWRSVFKIRPLDTTDVSWLFPGEDINVESLSQLDEIIAERTNGLSNEQQSLVAAVAVTTDDADESHTFVTLDDEGNVLELARSDITGIYVRSNGQWFLLDPNAEEEDQPTVWDREWVDVTDAALEVFDVADMAQQQLTRADFENYIVPQ